MELEKKNQWGKIIWISCVSNIILTSDEILKHKTKYNAFLINAISAKADL